MFRAVAGITEDSPMIVKDWRSAWRWHSVRASTLGFIITSVASGLALSGAAAAWVSVFDLGIVLALAAVICALTIVGRLINQGAKDAGKD